MTRRSAFRLVPLVVAVFAVAVALVIPSPAAPESAAGPTGPVGPLRLADAWPNVRTTDIPADLPDGWFYHPLDVVDGSTSVGTATSPDVTVIRLMVRAGDATVRVIRSWTALAAPAIAGTVVSNGRLFWIETGDGPDGNRLTTVWRVNLDGGAPVLLAQDSSDVLYYDSGYDLQIGNGRAYWAAALANGKRSEIRSVPVDGGPVTVRPLDGFYSLTAWPWATTSGGYFPGSVQMLNLLTGETRTVPGESNEILACTPTWCRVTVLINGGQTLRFEEEHVDGTFRRKVGGTARTPLSSDVALLDRFEVLTASLDAAGPTQRLWLLDLKDDRLVVLEDTSSAAIGSRGPYLWWSTGDNETLSWHVLDLRTLA